MFSVVIPLYNKAPYITATLSSVLRQTELPVEIIVVDDGSTDDGAAMVEGMNEPLIKIIRQSNGGVSAARNAGIEASTGEWVAFLDGDDRWHPGYLASQRALIEKYALAAFDVAAFGMTSILNVNEWNSFDELSAVKEPAIRSVLIDDLPSRWMKGLPFFTGSIVVRRSRLDAMQPCFPVGESMGEDLDLWFRLGEVSKIALAEEGRLSYRLATPNNLTSAHARYELAPYIRRMKERAASTQLSDRQKKSIGRYVAAQKISAARECLIAGRRGHGIKLLGAAFPAGMSSRRWWLTACMAIALPRTAVRTWQKWRYRKLLQSQVAKAHANKPERQA